MTTERAEIRIEMLSNPLYLSGVREMVAGVARRLLFTEEACGQIALAVDEALCNVIRHGYGRDPDKPIWINLIPLGGVAKPGESCHPTEALKIVIEDEARQVDPGTIKSRNLEDVRPGGLGVHIIRAVMDEVRYEKINNGKGRGMRLTMIKKRVDPSPEAEGAGGTECCGGGGGGNGGGGGSGCPGGEEKGHD